MKRLLTILFLAFPLISMAQNFKEDGEKYDVYCSVKNISPREKYAIHSIDILNKNYVIVDKEGNRIKTNSDSEVLSLLSKRGWCLVSSYYTMNDKLYFIMKKKVSSDEEIKEGLDLENK